MIDWKTELKSVGINLCDVTINRCIFPGDSFSTLLFVISLISLTLVLRWMKQRYSFQKGKSKLKELIFMNDLKLYGRNQNEIESLLRTVEIVTKDIV